MDDEGLVTPDCRLDITVFGVVRLGWVFGVVRLGWMEENVSGMVKFGCAVIKPIVEMSTRPIREMR